MLRFQLAAGVFSWLWSFCCHPVIRTVTKLVTQTDSQSDGTASRVLPSFCGGVAFQALNVPQKISSHDYGQFQVKNVMGDGRCLFRALALLHIGDQDKFQTVIDDVVNCIENSWEAYQMYITWGHAGKNLTVDSYRRFMQYGSAYGTIAELMASAKVLNAHIRVFNLQGKLQMNTDSLMDMETSVHYNLCFIGSQDSGHYAAMVQDTASIAPGPGAAVHTDDCGTKKRKRSTKKTDSISGQYFSKLMIRTHPVSLGPFDSETSATTAHDFASMVCVTKPHVSPQYNTVQRPPCNLNAEMFQKLMVVMRAPIVIKNRFGYAVWTNECGLLVSLGKTPSPFLQTIASSLVQSGWEAVTPDVVLHAVLPDSSDNPMTINGSLEVMQQVSQIYKVNITVFDETGSMVFSSKKLLSTDHDQHIYFLSVAGDFFSLSPVDMHNAAHGVQHGGEKPAPIPEIAAPQSLQRTFIPLNVNGELIHLENISKEFALELRDVAVILTKQRKSLYYPMTKYFNCQGLLEVPNALHDLIKPLITSPMWVGQKTGVLFWTHEGTVLQSMPVIRDHCTLARALAALVHGCEQSYESLLEEVEDELSSDTERYNTLVQKTIAQEAAHEVSHQDEAAVSQESDTCLDNRKKEMAYLAAAAQVLQIDVVVWKHRAIACVSTNTLFGFTFTNQVQLLEYESVDGACYEPFQKVPIVELKNWVALVRPGERVDHLLVEEDEETILEPDSLKDKFQLIKQDMQAVHEFLSAKADQPLHICVTCHRLFFRKQVSVSNTCRRRYELDHGHLDPKVSFDGTEYICYTCKHNVMRGMHSEYAVKMGYEMNPIPEELSDLTELETRLIAANTPFMQIRKLPINMQRKMTGAVINVPNDLSLVMQSLPATSNLDATIMVRFKRKLAFKHAYKEEAIRPGMVLRAIHWLCKNATLWDAWKAQAAGVQEAIQRDGDASASDNASDISSESEMDEEDTSTLEANQQTVVQPLDASLFAHDRVLNIAPAESSRPEGIHDNHHAEERGFPNLFGGLSRKPVFLHGQPMPYSRIVNWELMHYDGRFRKDITNIFFKMFKLRVESITKLAAFKVRAGKMDGVTLTLTEAQDQQFLQKLAATDVGFHDFRRLRGCPAYFAQARRDAFAMLRQCGKPTWFFTLSAADTRWGDLLRVLYRLAHDKDWDSEIHKLNHMDRSRLIAHDPITCVRYFHHRVMSFVQTVLCRAPHVLGTLIDFFVRLEAQHRGSMHLHGLGYTPDAPVWNEDNPNSRKEVCAFVDKHVTCSATAVPWKYLQLQIHTHNRHCHSLKRGCKAMFPRFPMRATTILCPLQQQTLQPDQVARLKGHSARIRALLTSMYEDMRAARNKFLPVHRLANMEDFLAELQLSNEEYLAAVAFTLERPSLFLRRMPNEILINNYSPCALMLWEANMDLQYVLDPYSAAAYATSYMTKADKGNSQAMVDLLKHLNDQAELTVPDIIKKAGNVLINSQEVCAQEACYLVLGLPFRVSTRAVQFVPTQPPDERIAVLRNKRDLSRLDEGSSDIFKSNVFDYYSSRPAALENVCLADFIAYYDVRISKPNTDSNPVTEVTGEAEEVIENSCISQDAVHLPARAGRYHRRKHAKILRWVNYSKEISLQDHHRELLLLFKPWRNEAEEINVNPSAVYLKSDIHALVTSNAANYTKIPDLEALEAQAQDAATAEDQTQPATTAHPMKFQAVDLHDHSAQPLVSDAAHEQYDIGEDVDTDNQSKPRSIEKLSINLLPQADYYQLVNNLNHSQRKLFNHVMHLMKTDAPPFHVFVSGGAGVGKSFVLRAIDQCVKRIFLGRAGCDLTLTPVVILAPTGTAAFQVSGLTIHSALAIPANKELSTNFKTLSFDKVNTLRAVWANVKLLIIDEISMVGCRMLQYVNLRLQQIRNSTDPFGGIPLIVFGDLYQLRPVMDGWVFKRLAAGMGALVDPIWRIFRLYELTEVMRQNNAEFIERLNRLRKSCCTVQDLAWWQSRIITPMSEQYSPDTPHLFQRNIDVRQHNSEYLQRQHGDLMTITAVDSLPVNTTAKNHERIMARVIKMKIQHTANLPQSLDLKLNVPVELTTNIDVSDGLTNGATGHVVNWSVTSEGDVACVYVCFSNAKCGIKARAEHTRQHQGFHVHPNWTPIFRTNARFKLSPTSAVEVLRQQFPVRLCAARTIHRVQGQSLQSAILDFKGRPMQGLHYVGASRLVSPTQLWFLNFNAANISASTEVTAEYSRMRQDAQLCLTLPDIAVAPEGTFVLTALNARSLHHNMACIRADRDLCRSDFLSITETWALPTDADSHYDIPGLHRARWDSPAITFDGRPHRGIMLYCKQALQQTTAFSDPACDIATAHVQTPFGVITIHTVYKSPQLHINSFLAKLEAAVQTASAPGPTVIMGDFNIDIKDFTPAHALTLAYEGPNHHLRSLIQFMCDQGFSQHLQGATADSGLQIDHIWSNINQTWVDVICKPFISESFYTDHRPVGLLLSRAQH